jgi:hypothetical protein
MFKALLFSMILAVPLIAEMKVLAFSGSTRADSFNKKLVLEAAEAVKKS